MKRTPSLLLLLAVAAIFAPSSGQAQQDEITTLQHQLLLMTTPEWRAWATGFLEDIAQGYGVPMTVLELSAATDLAAVLWERRGGLSARYSGVIMHPDLEGLGLMTRAQLRDFGEYQRVAGARAVKFGAPLAAAGLAGSGDAACARDGAAMRLLPAAPVGVSGVRPGAVFAAPGIRRCAGRLVRKLAAGGGRGSKCCAQPSDGGAAICGACRVSPVLRVDAAATNATAAAPSSAGRVAGVLTANADGRQALAFALDCSAEAAACYALGHLGLAWALRDFIPGSRRVLLSLQVDDVLLATDNAAEVPYRTTPADLRAHVGWQDRLRRGGSAGTDVRAELAFNGNGVLIQAKSPAVLVNAPPCFDTPLYRNLGCACWGAAMAACAPDAHWFCRSCVKDWKRVRGSAGVTYAAAQVGDAAAAAWSGARLQAGDLLYALVQSDPAVRGAFFWSSHTFSHQMLDNATREAAAAQLALNARMAGPGFLNISGLPTYSPRTLVTPAISGLFNGDALAAAAAAGVTTVVGDNTWPVLVNRANPCHMLMTTEATNGFPALPGERALAIMPRWATGVAYFASTGAEALAAYNAAQPADSARRFNALADLIAAEADRVVRTGLLALRHDGHMFHQANLRVAGSGILDGGSGGCGSEKSLLMAWADAVLARLSALVDWPVRSLKLDDLATAFAEREARDACRLVWRLRVSRARGGAVVGANVTSGAAAAAGSGGSACRAPVIVRSGVNLLDARSGAPAAARAAQEGPRTLHVAVPPGGSVALRVPQGAVPWEIGAAARR